MLSGWKALLAVLGAAGALAGTTFVVVDELIDPGADAPSSGSGASADGDGLVIRAVGDSVTAGFGYAPGGEQISVGDLRECLPNPSSRQCQDPAGVAYPARFARRHGGADFENLAVSGSTPADWLGEGRVDLSSQLDGVVEDDPDLTVLTVGANPLLSAFLAGGDRVCATTPFEDDARECVRVALRREQLLPRLARIYATLLNTDPDGRNGLVVVFQYPETHPPSAFGVRTRILVGELRSTIERAANAVREADPDNAGRLIVADPGPFLDHGCLADAPWILRVDSCIHPNFAGHEQMANELEQIFEDRSRAVVETAPPKERRFATVGTSCGVSGVENAYTSDPGDAFESRLGVSEGRLPCEKIEALFERYASDRSPCPEHGAGTCWREYGKWRCVAPTYALYPADFTCSAPGDEDGISQIVGLYAKETAATAERRCGSTRLGGGPYEIEANFDCQAARRIATSALVSLNFGFLCETERTGLESSRTECRLDGARLKWINGA